MIDTSCRAWSAGAGEMQALLVQHEAAISHKGGIGGIAVLVQRRHPHLERMLQ